MLQSSVCSLLREHFLLSSQSLRDKYRGCGDFANDHFTEYGHFVVILVGWLIGLTFYVPLDQKWVILELFFPANIGFM